MTFGKGAVTSSSNKMKCNTKSSTETEIIALGDKLSDVLWTRYFVECQGYNIDECIIFQDNMSALSLEKNGRVSSSKRTKHIKAKYFLIKDYYDAGEIDLRYCPTDSMWADVLTKPLQGQKTTSAGTTSAGTTSAAPAQSSQPLRSGLNQDSTLIQILSNGVLALDNANTKKSL
jgi:hypothetical protein